MRYDDDENFEVVIGSDGRPIRILRDGGRLRVPLQMRDVALRAGSYNVTTRRPDRRGLHDGRGNYDTVGHKPGFVMSDRVPRPLSIYDEYDQRKSTEWRNPTGDAEGYGEIDIGTRCTVRDAEYPDEQGAPGHVRRVNGKIICVPDRPDAGRDRRTIEDAYRQYDAELRNRWRNP
jgi:hypothetical protein